MVCHYNDTCTDYFHGISGIYWKKRLSSLVAPKVIITTTYSAINTTKLSNWQSFFSVFLPISCKTVKLLSFQTARCKEQLINTLRPRQNGRHFADGTFKHIFLNENVRISIKISLKFVPKGSINNITALVQIMAWRRPGDKPLSEPMMVRLLTHVCVIRPQWVKHGGIKGGVS